MIRQLTDKFYILLFLLISILSNAQTIDNIEVRGCSNFTQADYAQWINLKNQKYLPTIPDTIKKHIAYNLQQNGYYDFNINSIRTFFSADSQKVVLKIHISEGEPRYINKVTIQSLDSLDIADIIEKLAFLEGSQFSPLELERSISELLTTYENKGFPFASINIESIFFFSDLVSEKKLVDILLGFSMNRSSTIDTIVVAGNLKTKSYVITRELRINKGDVYSQKKMENIPTQLNRLHFFELVEQPTYFFDSQNKGVLQIDIVEKNTNSFDGILGYIPPGNNKGDGYLTGLVNVNLRNIFGTGRSVSVKWSKLDRFSQELEIKYLEPWIFGLPFNIDLQLFQRQQDTIYVQRTLNGNIVFLATESFSAALAFEQEATIPTNSEKNVFTVFNSVSTNSGINFKYDSRDNIFVPTRGFYFFNSLKYISKSIKGPSIYIDNSTNTNPKQYGVELDLLLFRSFFIRHIPFVGLHLRELWGDDIEVSDMYRIGGNNTLRGYQENQFNGNRVIWTNIEYRYLVGQRSYAFIFTDIAYYRRDANQLRKAIELSTTKIGYGIGMTFETSLGMLAVSYALAKGDSFNRGKIHFGLIGEF